MLPLLKLDLLFWLLFKFSKISTWFSFLEAENESFYSFRQEEGTKLYGKKSWNVTVTAEYLQ
jgi:hypothetical protein